MSATAGKSANNRDFRFSARPVPHCPACGNPDPIVAFKGDDVARERFRDLSRRKFDGAMDGWEDALSLSVRLCAACGHHWHADQPDQESLFRMYEAKANRRRGKMLGPSDRYLGAVADQARILRDLSARGGRQPRLLDYGSGAGLWTDAFVAVGFDVVSYEPVSERSTLVTEDTGGVDHDLVAFDGETFDVINLEQVLEHVPDPVLVLSELQPLCHPHTVVRASVPDFASFAAKNDPWNTFPYTGKTHLLSPFEHLHGFSARSLRQAFRRGGYRELNALEFARSGCWRPCFRMLAGYVVPRLAGTAVFARPSSSHLQPAKKSHD